MDVRLQQAREHHRAADADGVSATRHREMRDQMIRQLRAEDPAMWTYPALAAGVGCSPELIAYILSRKRSLRAGISTPTPPTAD